MKRGIIILILSILFILPIIKAEACTGTISGFEPTVFEDCSDFLSTNPCFKASDGNVVTGWKGTMGSMGGGYYGPDLSESPKWIYGDLGERKCLREIRVRLLGTDSQRHDPQTVDIQVSDNAIDWTTIYSDWTIDRNSLWISIILPEIKTRYVRFWITDCNYWVTECPIFGGCVWEKAPYFYCNIQEFQFRTRDICTTQCTGKECGDDSCGGTCPPGCSNPHGTTTCSAVGLCQPVCEPNWGNCDGDNTNGCETDLRTIANCGSCGNACTETQLCSAGSCISPSSVYWANMLGQPITEAQIGDTVLMVYTLTDLTTFEIREDDTLNDDNIRTGAEALTGNIIDGKAIAKWTITQQDFDLGFADELPLDTNVEFFFQIGTQTSDNLIVQKDSYNNQPPTIQLIKPTLNQKSKIQTSIDFEQIAEDEDDDLKIIWDFGDNAQETLTNCLTGTNCNTTHSYSDSGTKTITLTTEEMTRPKKDSKTTQILLYKSGINLFPIITSPTPGTVIQGTQDVFFNTSSSFVAECSSVCPPSKTCYIVSGLQCYDYPKTGIPSQYNLWFNWTFSEGLELMGNWTNNYNQVVEFTKTFYNAKKHWAKLKLGYEASPIQWSSDTYADFEIISTTPQCTIEDDASYWKYWDAGIGSIVTEPVTNADANCYNPLGNPTTCCPNNWGECITDSSDSDFGKCNGLPPPFLCSDYNAERYGGDIGRAETACENFQLEVANRSISKMTGKNNFCSSVQSEVNSLTGQTCWWLITDCECKWDDTTDPVNPSCIPEFSRTDSNCQGGPSSNTGTCTFNAVSQTGNCDAGDDYTTYTWDAQWSGDISEQPPECTSETKSFACEQNIKMPFFTPINFIITLIAITLIYTILITRKKNSNLIKAEKNHL